MFGFGSKAKNETWTAIVVRKGQGSNVDEDGERSIYYTLDVTREDNGKKVHYVVGRGQVTLDLFKAVKEGDKVKKPIGTKLLEKV